MTVRAKIVADSISPLGYRITSFEVYYPRFILAEVNTHRMIAKSSASSRAIPLVKRIQQVLHDPFIPSAFGKNKPGMQADENLSEAETANALEAWMSASRDAVKWATKLKSLGVHKQLANRILEPFAHVHTVLTGTEWANFFALRTHKAAQPEFRELALCMQDLYYDADPRALNYGDWHLPYVGEDEIRHTDPGVLPNVSAARCARVSYKTHDGRVPSLAEDLSLAHDLKASGHLSPFDHPAYAVDPRPHSADAREILIRDQRHLVGWVPLRTETERALDLDCRRFS